MSHKIHISRYLKQQDTSRVNRSSKNGDGFLEDKKEYTHNTISIGDILMKFRKGSSLDDFAVLDFDSLNNKIDHDNTFWTKTLETAIRIANYRQVGKLSYTRSSQNIR